MKLIERAFNRIMYGKPDCSIKTGDKVKYLSWIEYSIVVDINWALRAAAIELVPGVVIVLPVGELKKYSE